MSVNIEEYTKKKIRVISYFCNPYITPLNLLIHLYVFFPCIHLFIFLDFRNIFIKK